MKLKMKYIWTTIATGFMVISAITRYNKVVKMNNAQFSFNVKPLEDMPQSLVESRRAGRIEQFRNKITDVKSTPKINRAGKNEKTIPQQRPTPRTTISPIPTKNQTSTDRMDELCRDISYASNMDIIPDRLKANIHQPNDFFSCGEGKLLKPHNIGLDKNIWMLFMVKTAPGNTVLRDYIRHTWGSISKINGRQIRQVFLLGKTTEEKQFYLETENSIYGDMLQCDLVDTYHNITLKILSTYRWSIEQQLHPMYYTHCDDDIAVDIATTFQYFATPRNDIVCGFKLAKKYTPQRDRGDKWRLKMKLYNSDIYPTFCHGAMYTLTPHMLQDLYCMARVTNVTDFFIDDVLITGILRYKMFGSTNRVTTPILNKKKVELMYYVDGEGTGRVDQLVEQWDSWKAKLFDYEIETTQNYYIS